MADQKTIISVNSPTPTWANWVFRVVFLLNKVALGIIASDPGIDANTKVRIAIYLSGLDALVWGLSRMIGVKLDESDVPKKQFDGPGGTDPVKPKPPTP